MKGRFECIIITSHTRPSDANQIADIHTDKLH